MGVAQTKPNELLGQIIDYANNGPQNQFHTHRYLRAAERMVASNPSADAFQAMAIIQRVSGNIKAALANFQNALNFAPRSSMLRANYAACLNLSGSPDRAVNQLRMAWEYDEGNPNIARDLVINCSSAGLFTSACHWIDVLDTLKADIGKVSKLGDIPKTAASILLENEVSEQDVNDVVSVATELMTERGFYTAVYVGIAHDDDSQWISMGADLPASPKEVVEIGRELHERLAVFEPSKKLAGVAVFRFTVDSEAWRSRQTAS